MFDMSYDYELWAVVESPRHWEILRRQDVGKPEPLTSYTWMEHCLRQAVPPNWVPVVVFRSRRLLNILELVSQKKKLHMWTTAARIGLLLLYPLNPSRPERDMHGNSQTRTCSCAALQNSGRAGVEGKGIPGYRCSPPGTSSASYSYSRSRDLMASCCRGRRRRQTSSWRPVHHKSRRARYQHRCTHKERPHVEQSTL